MAEDVEYLGIGIFFLVYNATITPCMFRPLARLQKREIDGIRLSALSDIWTIYIGFQ